MPKLILKSPYLKCGGKGGGSVSGYLRYIGTRDGVELVPEAVEARHKAAGAVDPRAGAGLPGQQRAVGVR